MRAQLHSPIHHSPRHSIVEKMESTHRQEGQFMTVLASNYDTVINIVVLLGAQELATLSSTCKLFCATNLPHFHSDLSLVEYAASLRCKHAVSGQPLSTRLSATCWQRLFYSVERDAVLGRAPGAFAMEAKRRISALIANYIDTADPNTAARACVALTQTHAKSDTDINSTAFSVYPRLGPELLSAVVRTVMARTCSHTNRRKLALLVLLLVRCCCEHCFTASCIMFSFLSWISMESALPTTDWAMVLCMTGVCWRRG
jgi:hypothetical protein